MAKRNDPPPLEPREFRSPHEIDVAIKQLTRRIGDLQSLDVPRAWTQKTGEIEAVTNALRSTILEIFGENSTEYRQYKFIEIWEGPMQMGMDDHSIVSGTILGQRKVVGILNGLIRRLKEKQEDMGSEVTAQSKTSSPTTADSRNIFLVHGHDVAVTESVARFLTKLDLKPIILHEQPNQGRTIIEKFEHHADVGFAVVLLTPDDKGGPIAGDTTQPRARQNVILELGYFIGKLGRARVCPLYVEGVELPSDLHGMVWVPYDEAGGWRLKVASEIRAAGLSIDLNRAGVA
jgi:predicted nucleotide-binding protein